MNMAFQADQTVKNQILNCLGTDQIFRLLSDTDVNILMKTLGLLRNLLSTKPVSLLVLLTFYLYNNLLFSFYHFHISTLTR